MFGLSSISLFIATSWLLILSPGPDSIYVLTRGISLGKKAGITSAIGVTLGIFVHTAFAALGISVILMTSATLFAIVKIIGTVYLIYLGIKTLFEKDKIFKNEVQNISNHRSIFIQGILSNTLNPKVALFFLSYLPQFVTKGSVAVSIQMLFMGTLFAIFTVIYLLSLGYFAGRIGNWISKKEYMMRRIRYVSGSILIALGIRLAFIRRN